MPSRLLPLVILFLSFRAPAQTGFPLSKVYDGASKLGAAVHGFAQDKRGVIYMTTFDGVTLYDGVQFTYIPLKDSRCLAIDANDDIYVSAFSEFGRLESDAAGVLHYKSLLPLLKDSVQTEVFTRLYNTKEKVYCNSNRVLLEYDKKNSSITPYFSQPNSPFSGGFIQDDTFYFSVKGKGLMTLKDGKIVVAPFGDDKIFKSNNVRCPGLTLNKNQRILGLGKNLFRYSGSLAPPVPFTLEKNFLSNSSVYAALTLSENRHILTTTDHGAILIDTTGKILNYYSDSTGLPGKCIVSAFQDRNKNIWLGFYGEKSGVAKTEQGLDMGLWDERTGVKGSIISTAKLNDSRYLTTIENLYSINNKGQVHAFFRVPEEVSFLTTFRSRDKDRLLITGSNKIGEVSGERYSEILKAQGIFSSKIRQSIVNSNRFYCGGDNFGYLSNDHEKWEYHEIKKAFLKYFTEDEQGTIWFMSKKSIGRIILEGENGTVRIKSEDYIDLAEAGLPKGIELNRISYFSSQVLFYTNDGPYFYNEKTKRLLPWHGLGKKYEGLVKKATSFVANNHGTVIFILNDTYTQFSRLYVNQKGDTVLDENPLKRLPNLTTRVLDLDEDGTFWIGGTKGLLKYDFSNDTKDYNLDFKCLVRKVTLDKDSVLFGGGLTEGESGKLKPELNYNFDNLRFSYAAPFFDKEEETLYAYQLEGRDAKWSEWSKQTFKEYSDLYEGTYTFSVKAKNIYGKESSVNSFTFVVLPPWYRAWWAYCLYFLMLGGVVFGLVRWRTHALSEKKKELENIVNQKTKELVDTNHELAASQEELRQSNDELMATNDYLQKAQRQLVEAEKMASLGQLTAGLAHEINNPINFISGGVQALEGLQNEIFENNDLTREEIDQAKQDVKALMKSITNGVTRTAGIIKSLKVFSSPSEDIDSLINVLEPIENSLVLVGSKLANENISVERDFQHQSAAKANSSQISQVLINLLDNAIHALQRNTGKKIISIHTLETKDEIIIKIKDNGSGIPEQVQHHIFEPFFTTKEVGAGTGLGLSVSYSIIKRHHGKITFVSTPSEGTEFAVALPKVS
jgi:signal transduction histidine kinase